MTGTSENSNAGSPAQQQNPVPSPPVPTTGRLLGLDYGTRRIGIAVSTDDQTIASPLENYTRQRPDVDAKHLEAVVTDYEIVGLVVGLPVHISGDEGGKAREARIFGEWVRQVTKLPVCFWDERFTTAQANEIMRTAAVKRKKRKAFRDQIAAQVLLQAFLDSHDRTAVPQSFND